PRRTHAGASSCGRGDFGRSGRVDVRSLPQLEHQQAPEPVPVIGPALDVLAEQPFDRFGTELPAGQGPGVEQHVVREAPQLTAEPARERDAEAGLAPAGDLGRELYGECPSERLLAASAA